MVHQGHSQDVLGLDLQFTNLYNTADKRYDQQKINMEDQYVSKASKGNVNILLIPGGAGHYKVLDVPPDVHIPVSPTPPIAPTAPIAPTPPIAPTAPIAPTPLIAQLTPTVGVQPVIITPTPCTLSAAEKKRLTRKKAKKLRLAHEKAAESAAIEAAIRRAAAERARAAEMELSGSDVSSDESEEDTMDWMDIEETGIDQVHVIHIAQLV